MFLSSSRSHSQVGRVRMSPSELNKETLSFRQGCQVSPRQAIMDAYGCRSIVSVIIVKKQWRAKNEQIQQGVRFCAPCYNYSPCE